MSHRWNNNQSIGDCKTCLCRKSKQNKNKSDFVNDDEESIGFVEGRDLYDSQMSTQLLNTLKSMRDDESLCDVKLCVNFGTNSLKKYPAHKVVLAAASPYFRKMFSCGMKESNEPEVNFHDIQPEVLLSVIDFIYTGRIQIDESIVDGLLDAGDLLQMPSLRNLCLWWLQKNLSPVNCLGIYILSIIRSHLDLAQIAKNFAINNFKEVLENEEFLHLSEEHLSDFLDSPYLNCESDGHLLKGLIYWTTHDPTKRTLSFKTLFEKVNLDEIQPQILVEVLQDPIVSEDFELDKVIRETLSNALNQYASRMQIPNSKRCFHQQDVLFAIGGESQGQSLSNVECFTMGYDSWKCSLPFENEMNIIPTMRQCRYYSAIAYDAYSIYVIGGQDCGFPLNIVEKYDALRNQWSTLNELPISLHGSGAAFVNTKLYLAGGRSQCHERRVWIHSQNSDTWNETTSMKYRRVHLTVNSFNGELYAIGGIGGLKEGEESYLNAVEKFDPLTNTWTELQPMFEERAFHSSAVVDCFIYSIGGCNGKNWLRTVERYDTMSGQWSKVSNMSISRSSFGTSVTNGRIYCCGGFDGVHFLNTVEKYNPRTDRWHCVSAMQIDRYGLVVAKLSVPIRSGEFIYS